MERLRLKRIANYSLCAAMITVSFILTNPVMGQENESVKEKTETSEMKRETPPARAGAQRGRGYPGAVEVKDPAMFNQSQEYQIFSGPQPGEPLPPLKVTGLNGEMAEKEFDPIAHAGGKPLMIIFMDDSGVSLRGLAGFSRFLTTIKSNTKEDLQTTVVFLADDTSEFAKKASNYNNFLTDWTLGVSKDGRDGPGAYGLNRNISETIIFAKEGKVTRNFVFPQGMLYPDPHVIGAVAELIGEERETVAKWLTEASADGAQMRGGETMQRGGNTPQSALRTMLEKFVENGKLSREDAIKIYNVAFPATAQHGSER